MQGDRATRIDSPAVQRVTLGRTGFSVSVAGLGCGGRSRLGQLQGASVGQSVGLVRAAIDAGVNFLDTAERYGTEEIVGRAVAPVRDEIVIATKARPFPPDGPPLDGPGLRAALGRSLRRLGTDRVEVFQLHGVTPEDYPYCRDELLGTLRDLRDEGSVGAIGLTEDFDHDVGHEMLAHALADDCWDVVMCGFNILNPSARHRVLPTAIAHDVGVVVMFAVRSALSQPDALRALVAQAVGEGLVDGRALDLADPLGFLVHKAGASSVIDAAYRFCRHEPGCHVVLTGTGDPGHLRANLASIAASPLSEADRQRLAASFGHLAHFAGN